MMNKPEKPELTVAFLTGLDLGIQGVVAELVRRRYLTSDSGDGVSKFAEDPTLEPYEDALPYAHVHLTVPSEELTKVADDLCRMFELASSDLTGRVENLKVHPLWPDGCDPSPEAIAIQASYDPSMPKRGSITIMGPGLLNWPVPTLP